MPIVGEWTIAVSRRVQTGEVILDVLPFGQGRRKTVRTPHVETENLPDALRKLADYYETHGSAA